jgi:hypothetical protein
MEKEKEEKKMKRRKKEVFCFFVSLTVKIQGGRKKAPEVFSSCFARYIHSVAVRVSVFSLSKQLLDLELVPS